MPGLSIAITATLPRDNFWPESIDSLSMIRTWTFSSSSLAANATDLSSSPSTAHIIALSFIAIFEEEGSQLTRFLSICSRAVTAGSPYIIVKLNAVVSYIIEEPSLRFSCRSSIRTDSSISASNSNIAFMRGASGCLFGIIKLPSGIS